jgi:hypothetical protein
MVPRSGQRRSRVRFWQGRYRFSISCNAHPHNGDYERFWSRSFSKTLDLVLQKSYCSRIMVHPCKFQGLQSIWVCRSPLKYETQAAGLGHLGVEYQIVLEGSSSPVSLRDGQAGLWHDRENLRPNSLVHWRARNQFESLSNASSTRLPQGVSLSTDEAYSISMLVLPLQVASDAGRSRRDLSWSVPPLTWVNYRTRVAFGCFSSSRTHIDLISLREFAAGYAIHRPPRPGKPGFPHSLVGLA